MVFKGFAEVIQRIKPNLGCDIGNILFRVFKMVYSRLNPVLAQVFGKGEARVFLEVTAEIRFVQECIICGRF